MDQPVFPYQDIGNTVVNPIVDLADKTTFLMVYDDVDTAELDD